jgi:broad specificity phosphatase PhoE
MSKITLVRHGQANTSARDEISYDQLSDLGLQQAQWLGQHLRATGERYERIYCGTLNRHQQTALGMAVCRETDLIIDDRLNEMEFFTLATLLEQQQDVKIPNVREEFVSYLPMLTQKWRAGAIINPPETYQDFADRSASVIAEIAQGRGSALVVTSGGFIGMALRGILGLDTDGFARLTLAIMNSSLHQLHHVGDSLMMTQFNAVPHLDHPDRHYAQTHL